MPRISGETVVVAIRTGEVIAGSVSARALRLVQEWAELHREQLMQNWDRAREQAPLEPIAPLPYEAELNALIGG